MSDHHADASRENRPFPRYERERLVVVPPYHRRPPTDYASSDSPLTAAEIGRQAMALRGWRRLLARFAGLSVD
jgi:hypothetical protein